MVHERKLGAWWNLATLLSVSRVSRQCNGASCAWLIPATATVLRGVKCNDIIADCGKDTLYGVVGLGRKKFAKVFVMPYGLQEKLCHLKSTCIQAKQLQYNNYNY